MDPSLSLCPTLGHNASTIPNNARPTLVKGLFFTSLYVWHQGSGEKFFYLFIIKIVVHACPLYNVHVLVGDSNELNSSSSGQQFSWHTDLKVRKSASEYPQLFYGMEPRLAKYYIREKYWHILMEFDGFTPHPYHEEEMSQI